ncbi:MAG: hypothetical protein AB1461_13415 [Thermodesulfobacteriota bacterium]
MNPEVTFDHPSRIITMRFAGTVNYDTLIGFMTYLLEHPAFNQEYDGICDTRDAVLELSYEDLIKFRAWLETRDRDGKSRGRWAIVADTNLNYATSRMWEGLSAGYYASLRVFKNEEDALAWLHARA